MVPRGLMSQRSATLSGRLNVARECVLYLAGCRRRYKVRHHSMTPTLNPGDYVLVNERAYDQQPPAKGDLVLAQHPHDASLVITKRVDNVCDNQISLVSDNSNLGQDSRHFGTLELGQVLGRVTAIIS